MKRLIIVGLVLLGFWAIFLRNSSDEESMKKINEVLENEENLDSEDVSGEEGDSEEDVLEEDEEEIVEEEEDEEDNSGEIADFEKIKDEISEKIEFKKEEPLVKTSAPVTYVTSKPVAKTVYEPVVQNLRTTDVKVYLYEYGIDISNKELNQGKIVFTVNNNGNFSHDFAIRGVRNFGKIRPGEIRTFEAVLGAKEFEIYSARTIDQGKGMTETFVVVK